MSLKFVGSRAAQHRALLSKANMPKANMSKRNAPKAKWRTKAPKRHHAQSKGAYDADDAAQAEAVAYDEVCPITDAACCTCWPIPDDEVCPKTGRCLCCDAAAAADAEAVADAEAADAEAVADAAQAVADAATAVAIAIARKKHITLCILRNGLLRPKAPPARR